MIDVMKSIAGKCSCGKLHTFTSEIYSGKGIIKNLYEYIKKFEPRRVYVLCDENTYAVAGKTVCELLSQSGIDYTLNVLTGKVHPDEEYIDAAISGLPADCNMIIAAGSGVINDIGKIVSKESSLPYVIVATAPSMDGYASMSSSVTKDGLKISLPSRAADIIIGDTDIVKTAPKRMFASGIGDMLAKYVSICEWRISHLITGEYYCESIAELVRLGLKKCTSDLDALMIGDDDAVEAIFNALIIGSVAMNYAGVSRPASGSEHYISHIIDMRSVEFGTPADFHGIQCGIATYLCSKLYEKLLEVVPDEATALEKVSRFNYSERESALREFLGKGAEIIIALEAKEGKFDKKKHAARLSHIIANWDEIIKIVKDEMPTPEYIKGLCDKLSIELDFDYLGIDKQTVKRAFLSGSDIRDKYILPRLLWDLGIEEEISKILLD